MKTRQEIEAEVQRLISSNSQILNRTDVTPQNNSLVAGMQAEVTAQIHALQWVLGVSPTKFPWSNAVMERLWSHD